jgi:hypothetical protein
MVSLTISRLPLAGNHVFLRCDLWIATKLDQGFIDNLSRPDFGIFPPPTGTAQGKGDEGSGYSHFHRASSRSLS